jgi:hypothetical protein
LLKDELKKIEGMIEHEENEMKKPSSSDADKIKRTKKVWDLIETKGIIGLLVDLLKQRKGVKEYTSADSMERREREQQEWLDSEESGERYNGGKRRRRRTRRRW